MAFVIHRHSKPPEPGPQPVTDYEKAWNSVAPCRSLELSGAPELLDEWVGRQRLLAALDQDWVDPKCQLVGLIGFGGQGKTSIARQWVDLLLNNSALPQPQGVFWWGFYEKRNVDEFFEAALIYLSGGHDILAELPSSYAKANFLAAMLQTGRYLFILDGLEVLQHQHGDEYGLLTNTDLMEFLNFFAAIDHESFCLITSRAPVYDLIHFVSYLHQDVNRLSQQDGHLLLENVGVWGQEEQIDRVVEQWDGHALTLSLLGSYLVRLHHGNVAEMPPDLTPTVDEPRYDRVKRLLRRYDEHLTALEREFLQTFSAFRVPVPEAALYPVFRHGNPAIAPLKLVEQLADYRMLRRLPQQNTYTIHPLIRDHYWSRLTSDPLQARAVHQRIAEYYLAVIRQIPEHPTIEDLAPAIEAVHHLCQAGEYDRAFPILMERLYDARRRVISHELGAYETALMTLLDFFPNQDSQQDPQVSDPQAKRFILNGVGFCLMNLGRLREAVPLFRRYITHSLKQRLWQSASIGYQNLTWLYTYLGELATSSRTAQRALKYAGRSGKPSEQRDALALWAWTAHLQGHLEAATSGFEQSIALQQALSHQPYLEGLHGSWYADHLRRLGQLEGAGRVTIANLKNWVTRQRWVKDESQCYRILGDLRSAAGYPDRARRFYNRALKLARRISNRAVLIEALLARGRWLAQQGNPEDARSDLEEALTYAVFGEYHLYEADIRIGLAWSHVTGNNLNAAQIEAERAQQMSRDMGYYWGQMDAETVFQQVANSALSIPQDGGF
ncbi:hypothetical protein ACN4EK_15735 [Pantanalinema rosaneae CENA516]|uniref:hypothetical protein n=1 Tax=Pantanalinema rosaneae TaxID=1620701 RepID=UPI003D6E3B07